jgi:hypothetical protein
MISTAAFQVLSKPDNRTTKQERSKHFTSATRPKFMQSWWLAGFPFVAVAASLGQLKALMQIAK